MAEQWRTNQVSSYRLTKSDVTEYLKNKFGNHRFDLEVCIDLLGRLLCGLWADF